MKPIAHFEIAFERSDLQNDTESQYIPAKGRQKTESRDWIRKG